MKNEDSVWKKNLELFLTFFKIGAFTFGGGYAMIPLIERETTEKHGWLEKKDILDIVAIAESTPGPIAVNAATFVGLRVSGAIGAFLATFGVVLPSFIIISLISMALREFENIKVVRWAFEGVRAGVLALILKAMLSMYKQCKKDAFSIAIMTVAFLTVALLKINVIFVIVGAAVLGVIFTLVAGRAEK